MRNKVKTEAQAQAQANRKITQGQEVNNFCNSVQEKISKSANKKLLLTRELGSDWQGWKETLADFCSDSSFRGFSGYNLAGFVQKDIRIFLSYRIKSREGNLKVASAWLFSQIKLPLKGQRQKILSSLKTDGNCFLVPV